MERTAIRLSLTLLNYQKNEKVDYVDERCRMPIFRDIELRGGGAQHVRFVFGSLKSKGATEDLVYEIFDQVVNYND